MKNNQGGLIILAIALSGLPSWLLAEQLEIEEIQVTARKMEESLQDIPDSITVITERVIENAGISSVEDFVQLIPNVVALQGIKPGFVNLTARGITTIQENEAPLAVIIDGVTVPALDLINQDLFDIQQIEVIKGPQGSLYGANAIAGAINITTKQPTNELEGTVKISGGNAEYKRIAGVISGPIMKDKVYFRGSVNYRDEDGTLKNIFTGNNVDFYEELGIRGQIRVDVSDNLTLDFRGKYIDTKAGSAYNSLTAIANPGQINDFDNVQMDYNEKGIDNREIKEFSFKADWEAQWGGTLTAITGYAESEDIVIAEADWLPTTATHFAFPPVPGFFFDLLQDWRVKTKSVNQEIRYISDAEQRYRYQVGVFYQKRERDVNLLVGTHTNRVVDGPFIEDDDNNDSELFAVFGQLNYDILDNLELTLGLRYDSDDRESRSDIPGGPVDVSKTFSKLQPKISLAYRWDENWMTYVTLARGFRSGGFNAGAQTIGGQFYPRQYQSETSDHIEVGFKASLVDGRVTVNAAAFHIDYENQQFFFPTITGQVLTNFPETSIDGVELELAVIPSVDWTITAAYGVSDATIQAADSVGSFEGNNSPLVSSYTMNIGVEYSHPITANFSFLGRFDYERRGPLYWDVANTLRTPEKDYVNMRAGVESENWSLMGFAKNLTNTRQPIEILQDFPPIGIGSNARRPNRERRYGVEFTYRY